MQFNVAKYKVSYQPNNYQQVINKLSTKQVINKLSTSYIINQLSTRRDDKTDILTLWYLWRAINNAFWLS